MKFSKLREYNMRNIFLEKSYINCGGETSLSPFSKKPKLIMSLEQPSKVLHNSSLLYVEVKGYRNILKLDYT